MTNNVIVFIEGWVWCETEFDIHEDVPDPHEKGPLHPAGVDVEEEGFHMLTDHEGWTGTYLHFICPGPHHWLRKGRLKT